ncbi:MAG: hypothetical protein ABW128_14030 [Rhizorhabdus sp.]
MGLADLEYMRERQRQRTGGTIWNNRKSRVELDDDVPLGGANWIGKEAIWASQSRNLDQHGRRMRREPRIRGQRARKWIILLSAMAALILAYREVKRDGWLPDDGPAITFPSTGSVTVNLAINPKRATSQLTVMSAEANAAVQLYDPQNEDHVVSVYVRRNDEATIPVPPGTYRLEVIEGDKWYGLEHYFGQSTTSDTVARAMTFTRRMSYRIDLHRTRTDARPTCVNFTNPKHRI